MNVTYTEGNPFQTVPTQSNNGSPIRRGLYEQINRDEINKLRKENDILNDKLKETE